MPSGAVWRSRLAAYLRRSSSFTLPRHAHSECISPTILADVAPAAGAATDNPYAVLTLIAAPAILTNASSVLALSTSNRFARAVDRQRQLSKLLDTESATMDADELRSAGGSFASPSTGRSC